MGSGTPRSVERSPEALQGRGHSSDVLPYSAPPQQGTHGRDRSPARPCACCSGARTLGRTSPFTAPAACHKTLGGLECNAPGDFISDAPSEGAYCRQDAGLQERRRLSCTRQPRGGVPSRGRCTSLSHAEQRAGLRLGIALHPRPPATQAPEEPQKTRPVSAKLISHAAEVGLQLRLLQLLQAGLKGRGVKRE